MLHFSRSASIIGAPLTLVALLACVTPAGARLASNGVSLNQLSANALSANQLSANALSANQLSANAIAQNGVPANARMTSGTAIGDLNGVAVEAVIIPDAALR